MEGQTVEKKQKTVKGTEIPVPKRADFFKSLKKAATPPPSNGNKK